MPGAYEGRVKDQFKGDGIVLDNALAFWVHRVYQVVRNETYRAFRDAGTELTPEQWVVLVRLWEQDGRTQNDLCDSTFRDRPTMSRMIDTLEARGLVTRESLPSDARARVVYLTREAKALKPKLVPVARGIVGRMLHGIPHEDLAITRKTLQRIFENLDR